MKCIKCNSTNIIKKDGDDVGDFPGIVYNQCNTCGHIVVASNKYKAKAPKVKTGPN